jgi:hypothetical protein
LLHLLAAGALSPILGLPYGLVAGSGAALVLFVALAAWLAIGDPVSRGGLALLVAANVVWVLACAAVFIEYGSALTVWGRAYLVVHGAAVALLAELEWFGLRRAPRAGWA